ncbi:hypothetical protein EYF80_001084 [Liparis tanakae]|uniref:Uncharacterized protein n=1 Tax=Liparis tanakae TaxID=230148 RepID=A0A4Z2JHL5_9TELE|nr:hypothetical protein EYF80_001084 [Liparis tanakae]
MSVPPHFTMATRGGSDTPALFSIRLCHQLDHYPQPPTTLSCFPSRQSNSLHLPLITPSLVPHYLHLVFMPVSPAAHSLIRTHHDESREMIQTLSSNTWLLDHRTATGNPSIKNFDLFCPMASTQTGGDPIRIPACQSLAYVLLVMWTSEFKLAVLATQGLFVKLLQEKGDRPSLTTTDSLVSLRTDSSLLGHIRAAKRHYLVKDIQPDKFITMGSLALRHPSSETDVGGTRYLNSTVAEKDSCSVMEKTSRKPSPLRK